MKSKMDVDDELTSKEKLKKKELIRIFEPGEE